MYSGLFAIALLLGPQASSHVDAKPATSDTHPRNTDGNAIPPKAVPSHTKDEPKASYTPNPYPPQIDQQPIFWWDHNWVGFAIATATLVVNGIGLSLMFGNNILD